MEIETSVPSPDQSVSKKPVAHPRRHALTVVAIVTGVLLVAIGSFALGFSAGLHKARFSYRFGENYERNFMKAERQQMKEQVMQKMDGKLFRSGHGVAGEIISISESSVIVSGTEGQENSIVISEATIIMEGGEKISRTDLATGERIVVLGKPGEDGSIQADLIRVFRAKEDRPDGPLKKFFR